MSVNKSPLCISSETVKLSADRGMDWLPESQEPTPHALRHTHSPQWDSPGESTAPHLAQSQVLKHRIRFHLLSYSLHNIQLNFVAHLEIFSSSQDSTQGIGHYLHQLLWLGKWVKDFSLHSWVVRKIDAMRICIKFSYTWRDLSEIRVTWANVSYTLGILDSNPYSANHSQEGF